MKLDIIGQTKDLRTDTPILYAQISIPDYLELVGDTFDEDFPIQRRKEENIGYIRMKNDILEGAVLPPITLALKPSIVDSVKPLLSDFEAHKNDITKLLSKPKQVFILDGLQRTYLLDDLKKQGNQFKKNQKLLLELWVENDMSNLTYRIIILNTGQKKMSVKHQLEILFATMKDELLDEIPNLDIYTEKSGIINENHRTKAAMFSFQNIVSSYHCFLAKHYETKKGNIVAQQMEEDKIVYTTKKELDETFNLFKKYLTVYNQLDNEVFRIYNNDTKSRNWLARENVMNSFFAALAHYGNNTLQKRERIEIALSSFLEFLKGEKEEQDALNFEGLTKLLSGINKATSNVGSKTKRALFEAFEEFFRESGSTKLADCWEFVSIK